VKFTSTYFCPKLDFDAYKKALDKQMREIVAQGLEAWLMVTTVEVPLWSGASRATFVKVGQLIDHTVATSGGSASFNRASTGLAMSTGDGFNPSDMDKGLYVFTYGTTLPWLLVNEYYNANDWGFHLTNPGPYEFQVKARAAFLHATKMVSLPKVAPFIRRQVVK
jgi:hypothetical protein